MLFDLVNSLTGISEPVGVKCSHSSEDIMFYVLVICRNVESRTFENCMKDCSSVQFQWEIWA